MPDRALTPFILRDDWRDMNHPDTHFDPDPVHGGFQFPDGTVKRWYLHIPNEGETLKLWDGVNIDQKPTPEPDPPGNFYLPQEEWDKIKGGRLLENRNWVAVYDGPHMARLFELVAVLLGEHSHVVAVQIG